MSSCAPLIHPETLYPLIEVESGKNPSAIAVVNGKPLQRQPKSAQEAMAVIAELEKKGLNYSVGLGQINKANFAKYNVTASQLLDPCTNLRVSQAILTDCYARSNSSVAQALSCYYSGNFQHGFVQESSGTAYVERVAKAFKPEEEFSVPSLRPELASIPAQLKKKPAAPAAAAKKTVSHGKPRLIKSIYARQSFSSQTSLSNQ